MAIIQSLYIFCQLIVIISVTSADPDPRRVPKVYNALITSSQNLEPSKAFPVYQPVLQPHPAVFPFPYQPFYYGDLPLSNGLLPAPAFIPKPPNTNTEESQPPSAAPKDAATDDKASQPSETPSTPVPESDKAPGADKTPPPPPNTEAPIPLNEFGLPPQILPLGQYPQFEFPHYNQFSYPYPSYRFYDPTFPFGFSPYTSWPAYQPLTNFVAQYAPNPLGSMPVPTPAPAANNDKTSQTPPSEPSDLNVLNYSSKDPAIPNVPPPPLPQGGLKSDNE